jgi:hypothetical protein
MHSMRQNGRGSEEPSSLRKRWSSGKSGLESSRRACKTLEANAGEDVKKDLCHNEAERAEKASEAMLIDRALALLSTTN